jgi:hypothetical protein
MSARLTEQMTVGASVKLDGYFRAPSIQRYSIADPERRAVIQHARQTVGAILTWLIASGSVRPNPPGLELNLQSLFD